MIKIPPFAAMLSLAFSGLLLQAEAFGQADNYPSRPVKIIVSYPPGGTTDLVARVVGQKLSEFWGQPVVVENRPGASGNIGTQVAAKSPADGYTILQSSVAIQSINPALHRDPGYDPVRDFASVAKIATSINVLVVNPQLPVRSVRELIAYTRANPGKVAYASPGSGTSPHLSTELFKATTGADALHVPYKGSAPMLADLIGGQVQFAIDNLPASLPHVRSGKLRALAVTGPRRAADLPDVPTMVEAGVAGYEVTTWWSFVVPAGTPPAVVFKINADTVRALQSADVRDRMTKQGLEPTPSTPVELDALAKAELARWSKLIKDIGARAD